MDESLSLVNVVIVIGLVVGSILVLIAGRVWLVRQEFGLGGSVLSFFGTVLIGLSVFSKAQISFGDVQIVLERLEQDVQTLQSDNQAIERSVDDLVGAVEVQRNQFLMLGTLMQQSESPGETPPNWNEFISPLRDRSVRPVDEYRHEEIGEQPGGER